MRIYRTVIVGLNGAISSVLGGDSGILWDNPICTKWDSAIEWNNPT